MSARRSITLYHAAFGNLSQPPNLPAEFVALLISALMLVGVALIRPIFAAKATAEAALHDSESTYRGILDNMADTFYRTDADGLIIIASPSATNLLGYSIDDLLGRSLAGLYLRPADREEFLKQLKANNGQIRGYVSPLRHKDGHPVLVETNARVLLDSNGVFMGVEGTARDITNRRRSEELNMRLGRIIEDSANEIYVFDSETLRFIQVNRGARENLGYTMAELREMTPIDVKLEYSKETFSQLIKPLIEGTRDVLDFETVHVRKNGSIYDIEVCLQLARSESPPVFFAIIQDITERKRAVATMLAAKDEAVHANRAKSDFLAHFSHELRTPLNAIIGFSEIMQSEMFGPLGHEGYKEYAHDIHQSGAHLLEIITDILEYSSIEAGKLELDEQLFDACEVAEECVRMLRGPAVDRGVNIVLRLPEGGLWLEADARMLRQILLNLLSNAVKFTRRNTTVILEGKISEFGNTSFRVSDCGEGMAASDIERVQEPFVRLQGAAISSEEGTGLGLAITKRLTEAHGAQFQLISETGVGTTATIIFPAERTFKAADSQIRH